MRWLLLAALSGVSLGLAAVLTWSLFTADPWLVTFNRYHEGLPELVLAYVLGLTGIIVAVRQEK